MYTVHVRHLVCVCFQSSPQIIFFPLIFTEYGREGAVREGGERNICVRETLIDFLLHTPGAGLGIELETQVRALLAL